MLRRLGIGLAVVVALGVGIGGLVSPTWSLFGQGTTSPGNSVGAATDFRAPTASASVIIKSEGGTPGYIRKGGAYTVLANVGDTGNPASGVSTVTANVTTVTAGQTASSLSAGSFSAGGTAYNRGSASLTAGASLAVGTYGYSLTSTDVAGNAGTQTGFSVIVDNTAPVASDVQTANAGGTAGKAELGDTITFTFSEPIEPGSILSGWGGTSTSVVVRIDDGTNLGLGNDPLTVWNSANSAQLPLGSVDLGRSDYRVTLLGLGGPISFGASGTPSTMVMSGNQVTVTLGTPSATADTAAGTGTMTWTPSTTPWDRAGNRLSGGAATESGSADKEF